MPNTTAPMAPRASTRELRSLGHRINRERVARLMRINHVIGRHLRRKKRTTVADRRAPPVPDLMMRDFTASALNTRWSLVTDAIEMAVAAVTRRMKPGVHSRG